MTDPITMAHDKGFAEGFVAGRKAAMEDRLREREPSPDPRDGIPLIDETSPWAATVAMVLTALILGMLIGVHLLG